jgi:hypothetical protein
MDLAFQILMATRTAGYRKTTTSSRFIHEPFRRAAHGPAPISR